MSNRRHLAEEKIFQKYFYPTDKDEMPVLVNKLGIVEQDKLDMAEAKITAALMPSRPKLNHFSLNEIKAIHKHLFHPIYAWAGNLRDYTTGRSEIPFARPELIERFYQKQIFEQLKKDDYLIGYGQTDFIKKSAYILNEFNAIHPFIDGNGRITRIILADLAEKAGYKINTEHITQENWYKAMEVGFLQVDTFLIEQEIAQCIKAAENR